MRIAAVFVAIFLIIAILWDAFETVVLPRRVTRRFRFTRLFYRTFWSPWSAVVSRVASGKRRETLLGYFGPLSLLLLLNMWAMVLVLGFALLHWANGSQVDSHDMPAGFATDLYLSGTTFFTLGLGDVVPRTGSGRLITATEGGMGFGFLAIVIGYLPIIYQAFSRREVHITLLDARGGSPASSVELLRRYAKAGQLAGLEGLLQSWEQWAADLMETHISYPVLGYFRSQHDNESWVAALTTMLDTCAVLLTARPDAGVPVWQAQLTFAMVRHTVVDLAQVFGTPPRPVNPPRLSAEQVRRLREELGEAGLLLWDDAAADQRLTTLRDMYEGYVHSMSHYFVLRMPNWFPDRSHVENWRTSAWGRISAGFGASSTDVH